MRESNNSENKIIISKEDTMFLYGNQTTVKTKIIIIKENTMFL